MNPRKWIVEELEELKSELPASVEGHIYEVPECFFENFAEQMKQQVRLLDFEAGLSKSSPFTLPENYFEDFEDSLKAILFTPSANEEIETLSPLLAGLKNKPTYSLPETTYFEHPVAAPEKPKEPKIIPFRPAERRITWTRWLSAAVVVAIFSIGGFKFLATPDAYFNTQQSVQGSLASIPSAVIEQYLAENMDGFDVFSSQAGNRIPSSDASLLNNLSDQEIEQILENE